MLRTIRTNFDRDEARRDQRYPLPPITVIVDACHFATANWSLGGFLLPAGGAFAIGARIAGELVLPADSEPRAFAAEVVHANTDGTGFRFVDSSPDLVGALDRVIARRMFGRRA